MRRRVLPTHLILILMLFIAACGGSDEPAQPTPTAPPTQAPLPTETPAPTVTPNPTPTPLSLSDVAGEYRTFINAAHAYAIQVPAGWDLSPRRAGQADRVEITAPGPEEIQGANTLPPLVLSIVALGPEAGYTSLSEVEEDRSFGDDTLDAIDVEVNGLPARRMSTWDDVDGYSLYYVIQRDEEFFIIQAYGYDRAPAIPIVNTFGPPPAVTEATVAGQVRDVDPGERRLTLVTEAGEEQAVRWFTDTEILPQGRLEGHIDAGDRISAEGVAGDNGIVEATVITLQVPQHEGSDAVLEFRRTGGVAGFQDELVIFEDGTARLRRGEGEPVDEALSQEQWDQVENYSVIFEPFAWHQEDNPDGPDNLVTDLDFYGTGRFESVFDNQQEIVNYLQELIAALAGD